MSSFLDSERCTRPFPMAAQPRVAETVRPLNPQRADSRSVRHLWPGFSAPQPEQVAKHPPKIPEPCQPKSLPQPPCSPVRPVAIPSNWPRSSRLNQLRSRFTPIICKSASRKAKTHRSRMRKSSTALPIGSNSIIQRGCLPRPDRVTEASSEFRNLGSTFGRATQGDVSWCPNELTASRG